MMTGAMPAASSQLVVDKPFVLRHLARGHGAEVMGSTLMADELRRDRQVRSLDCLLLGGIVFTTTYFVGKASH